MATAAIDNGSGTILLVESGRRVAISGSGGSGVTSVNGNTGPSVYLTQAFELTGVLTNNTAARISCLTGTITVPGSSEWIIDISLGFTSDSTTQDFELEMTLGGTSITSSNDLLVKEEQKDAAGAGTGLLAAAGTNQIHRAFARSKQTLTADTAFDVLFGGSNGVLVSIFDVLVVATRIS